MSTQAAIREQWMPRLSVWLLRLAEFGLVQVVVQGLAALAGILIVRNLSKHQYALFAIANSMQTACNLLADLGIGVGVRSIGGRVWNDRYRFGQLLNTAFGLRKRFAILSFSFCLPITAWMLWRNGASTPVAFGLCAIVAASVVPLLASSVWGISPSLHGEYRRIQKLDLGNAALRLALIATLSLVWINAFLASVVAVVSNWVQVTFLRRWAGDHADITASPSQEDSEQLKRLSTKLLPNTLFFCFQGQVTLFILTLLGNSTGIADVTALGRLAMILGIFAVTFGNVVGPRFARCQDTHRLPRLYVFLVLSSVLIMAPLLLFSWLFPDSLLWLLGSKYESLRGECVWVVAAGCVAQIGGVMWNLNSSKAWIRAQSPAFIPAILMAQIVAALFLNLRHFHDILIFNLITAAAPLPIYAIDAILGMRQRLKADSKTVNV
jgi:O-antigen/teichoic acid export membrane protein